MPHGVVLVICALIVSSVHCTGSVPNCAVPTFSEVEQILEESLQAVSESLGRSDTVRVNLTAFNPTCLSVSHVRDQYRVATVLVLFNFTGLPNYESCLPNQPCTGLFNMECLTDTTTWTFNRLLVLRNLRTVTVSEDAFTASPRLDCGLCNDRADAVDPSAHDLDTNCIVCDEACQGVGLGYCFGLRASDCCNFYSSGMTPSCLIECPANEQPDVNFNCIQGCDLDCVFGKPDSNCTECVCDPGYTGVNCTVNINECEGVSCGNGTCMDLINGFECNCSADFTGLSCDTRIDDCVDVNCNNGTCVDGIEDFTCICDPDFTSASCNTSIDDCVNNTCQNEAICIDGVQSYTCECVANFTGEFCELCGLPNCEACSGTPDVCSECEHGFVKTNDSLCVDTCSVFVCENNGTCVPPSDNSSIPSCMCAEGFEGTFCGTNTDDCSMNPCANGGTCMDGINSFTCMCAEGFEGTFCGTNTNDCSKNPCANGGSCMDGINSFTCMCQPGFTGDTCAIMINPCEDNPCDNGGTCNVVDWDQFNCTCLDNFEGETCQNCTISNCDICSQTIQGVCITCARNYRRDDDGTCFMNACTLSTPVDADQCDYYFSILSFYDGLTSICGDGINTELPDLPVDAIPLDVYDANIDIYLDLRRSWLAEIREFGIDTTSIDLPTSDQLAGKNNVEVWRLRLELWFDSTMVYVDYINQLLLDNQVEAGPLDIDKPDIDFENGDTDEIYDAVIEYWIAVVNFYNDVIPQVDFLCSPPGMVGA